MMRTAGRQAGSADDRDRPAEPGDRGTRPRRDGAALEGFTHLIPFGAGAVVLPSWVITRVSAVPGGSRPSCALGYCERDNDAYVRWDAVSRDRDTFLAWMDRNVLEAAGRQT
jgi:hypothetical protein